MCDKKNQCEQLTATFGLGNSGNDVFNGTETLPGVPGTTPTIIAKGNSATTSGVLAAGAIKGFRKAKLVRLQISYDPSQITKPELIIKRIFGTKNKEQVIPLEPYNDMDAFQQGKITLNCVDVALYAIDSLTIKATDNVGSSKLSWSATYNYEF